MYAYFATVGGMYCKINANNLTNIEWKNVYLILVETLYPEFQGMLRLPQPKGWEANCP